MKPIRIKHEAASRGIAIGRAHILSFAGSTFPKYWIADKEIVAETARLKHAIQKSKQQLSKIKEKLCRFQGKDHIQIIDTHSMLLQDEMLVSHAMQNIVSQKINAEWAVNKASGRLKMAFVDIKDEYFRQRKYDIDYVCQRITKNLLGGMAELSLHHVREPSIILVARDFSPADIVSFPRERIKGFITAVGGNTSHSAIIARSLEIPAMVGLEKELNRINENDLVVIDGIENEVVVNPSKEELAGYKKRQAACEEVKIALLKDAHLPAKTRDGATMQLVANIELSEEVAPSIQHGAEGVGLFRTEYLYANRMDYPSEEEQFECYRSALMQMPDMPVTIRTLDVGGDKLFIGGEYSADHLNPALGLRAVRLCLVEQELFRTQLRAMLRASVFGRLRMLLPMISGFDELMEVKRIIEKTKDALKKEKIKVAQKIDLGIMIEIPSAVVRAKDLAEEVDFFSIGTNDLIQYALAVDRTNEHVAYLYNMLNPAVITLLKNTVDAAKGAGIDVTVCGESASDPAYLLLFLGMGVDALSMNAISIPRVKKMLRAATAKEAKELFEKVSNLRSTSEIEAVVKAVNQKHSEIFEQTKSA